MNFDIYVCMYIKSLHSVGTLCSLGFIWFSITALGQTRSADTLFLVPAIANAKAFYTQTIGVESHLFNGVQYKEHNPRLNEVGNPYFLSDDWLDGTVFYDGEVHEEVPILYDIVNDKVVIEHGFSGAKLELISEKLKYFSIVDHRFVRLEGDAIKNSSLRPGFYDNLYDGQVKFYVKWQKTFIERIVSLEIHAEYLEATRYYIYKHGTYYSVNSKSSVLQVLKDRKAEIRKFIRKNNIEFSTSRELAIARVVSFYDQLGK